MVMGCGPGSTAAREEGLSTPRQLWLIRQQQSQQHIQRVEAVLIRLTLVRAPSQRNHGTLVEQGTFGQLQGSMLRGDVFSARGVILDMGLRLPVLLPAVPVAAAPEQAWRLPAPSA